MIQIKHVFLQFLALLLIAGMVCEQPAAAKKKMDLSEYSTTTYNWGLGLNTNHTKPGGSGPAGWELAKSGTYYVGKHSKKNPVIYLTFDCGYEAGYTKKILGILKKNKVKAIFFVTEAYIKDQPKLVKRMKKDGHLVGNHTCTHPQMSKLSISRLKREINQCAKTMKKLTGYKMDKYLRPPEGNFSMRSVRVTQSLGYSTIFWSLAYYDYNTAKQPGADYVVGKFKTYYHNGMIPLIHTCSKSNTNALNRIIHFLRKKGFRLGTLDEFIKNGEKELTNPENMV